MAEKTSTVIVYVDLDCRRCYRQIRKVLCKLQATADQERIRTISYNDKGQMITISGPFDPLQLCSKIRCMGGKVIKDIQIKPPPPPPPPPTCTCNKDIEQLKMRMEDLLRVCVGNNNDIEQLKQQVDRLLEQDQQISSCADLKRAIQQLEIRMAELHEMLSQKRPKCTGEPQGQKCGMVIIPSSDSCSYLKCHGHCGSPYCRCYASCRFSEEDSAAACSLM